MDDFKGFEKKLQFNQEEEEDARWCFTTFPTLQIQKCISEFFTKLRN